MNSNLEASLPVMQTMPTVGGEVGCGPYSPISASYNCSVLWAAMAWPGSTVQLKDHLPAAVLSELSEDDKKLIQELLETNAANDPTGQTLLGEALVEGPLLPRPTPVAGH
jgi:hypothetical protein